MREVSDKQGWPAATSVAGPAVTYSPAHGAPILAWRGNRNSRNLTIAPVVGTPGQLVGRQLETHVSQDSSDFAPAIHYSRTDDLVIGWVGINGGRTVNVAAIELPPGTKDVASKQRSFVQADCFASGGSGPPHIAPYGPFGLTLTCLNRYGSICFATAANGIGFGQVARDPSILAIEGVATEVGVAVWTRKSDNRLEFLRIPIGPNSRAVSAQTSLHRPAVVEYDGHSYVAWVGTDGEGHLNVARIDSAAWDRGGDPIDPNAVDTLTELSLAAPALVVLPAEAFSPQRLAIFWTGVDGTGMINGAVVYP